MDIRTVIKNILGKAKTVGSSILKRFQWKDFDAKSAAEGLEKLKGKEGFNKLPPEHQRKLIDDYMRNLK